jgi:hypothetical protein
MDATNGPMFASMCGLYCAHEHLGNTCTDGCREANSGTGSCESMTVSQQTDADYSSTGGECGTGELECACTCPCSVVEP